MSIDFHIVTLFPEFFASPLEVSLLGKARERGDVRVDYYNPRDFSMSRHKNVDDYPYGGGAGMVMQVEPVLAAIRSIPRQGRIIYLTPAGRPLDSEYVQELAREDNITLVCGRYEGIDERVSELAQMESAGLGDIVLNGGEVAALALIESVCRFVPGFMGSGESARDESFCNGLLEYPHYTRPDNFEGQNVPEVLLGGHHAHIERWRRNKSLERTLAMRPDMLDRAPLDSKDAEAIASFGRQCIARNIGFCLLHYPVRLDDHKIGCSSLTNLDLHDIARISRSYGMAPFYVLTPLKDQLCLADKILSHWASSRNRDRARALEFVRLVGDFDEMLAHAREYFGIEPVCIASSAQWPKKGFPLTPADIRKLCRTTPAIICLGTARGLAPEVLARCDGQLRPLRFLSDNHLSVRSAAAIIADRILGDFN